MSTIQDLTEARWRKSTYSTAAGECIEIADNTPGVVAVRDSKNPEGPTLSVGPQAWADFVRFAVTFEV